MQAIKLIDNIKQYVSYQLTEMSKSTPMIGIAKPLITRAINKKIDSVKDSLSLITDEYGEIDVKNILTEIIDNIQTSRPFVINNEFIGDIELGGGNVSFTIPMTDKKLVLNREDLDLLKEMLTSNN